MSLKDSIFGAGKWLIGTSIGAILMLVGLMSGGIASASYENHIFGSIIIGVLAVISFFIGLGLVAWGEKNRKRSIR